MVSDFKSCKVAKLLGGGLGFEKLQKLRNFQVVVMVLKSCRVAKEAKPDTLLC